MTNHQNKSVDTSFEDIFISSRDIPELTKIMNKLDGGFPIRVVLGDSGKPLGVIVGYEYYKKIEILMDNKNTSLSA